MYCLIGKRGSAKCALAVVGACAMRDDAETDKGSGTKGVSKFHESDPEASAPPWAQTSVILNLVGSLSEQKRPLNDYSLRGLFRRTD